MEAANFISPLQAVQTISIINYLNTLSDFLFASNFLNETNQYQPIPIVNALYNYIFDDYEEDRSNIIELNLLTKEKMIPIDYNKYNYSTINYHENRTKIINDRKIYLAQKLIEGTDLYGAEENEILDSIFVDALYKHIISTLVFEKFTNIYGFLVEIVRSSVDVKINTMYDKINSKLSEEIFLTENGREIKLEDLSVTKIVGEFIVPLLPKLKKEMNLTAVDYIYAAAGSGFLNSDKEKILAAVDYKEIDDFTTNDQFINYVTTAHVIEQSVIGGKIDKSALGIFGLPALLYYVYKEKEMLRTQSTGQIINNSTLRIEAYRMLFSYLNKTFAQVEQARNNDYRYQFYAALSNFKNRTTLARENISSKCSTVKDEDLKQEVLKYKNNPDDYQCNNENGKKLEDVNRLYQEQVNNIAGKYLTYEKESIREAFGTDFIRSVDANKVEISKGFITSTANFINYHVFQWVKASADLFQFKFMHSGTKMYFAVLREDNEIFLMQQNDATWNCSKISRGASSDTNSVDFAGSALATNSADFSCSATAADFASSTNSAASADFASSTNSPASTGSVPNTVIHCNPNAFRKKLEMSKSEVFRSNNFPYVMKRKDEKFEVFLNRIAEERAKNFNKSLQQEGYDPTRKEWWKDFGLSLLPFYTCIHGIRTKNVEEAVIGCSLDALFALPLVEEIGYLAEKLTTTITRSIMSSTGTTFGSLTLKMTIRETLEKLGSVLVISAEELSTFFSRETFQNLGLSVLRYVDPGFELIYTIGKGGWRSIITTISTLKKYSPTFVSLEKTLAETEIKLSDSLLKVSNLNEKEVYVNSLSVAKKSGYGYQFLRLPNKQVQIRQIREYGDKIPVVVVHEPKTGEITYRAINMDTGRIKPKVLHLQNQNLPKSALLVKIKINSFHDLQTCTNPRFKRSPTKLLCLRNILRNKRDAIETAAMNLLNQQTISVKFDEIRSKLREFIFPDNGELHMKFITDWSDLIKSGRKSELPTWSKKYELADPTLFEKLRYSDTVDKKEFKIHEASERLAEIFRLQERSSSIMTHQDFDFIRQLFNEDKAYESVTLQDYFAIREYMGMGYKQIGYNTKTAKKMRGALYRLAIRQSDDPLEEFSKILYRGETRSPEIVEKLFLTGKNEIELNRFTSTSTNEEIARMFQFFGNSKHVNIFYEIKFNEPFFRAKVMNVVLNTGEAETILLPGSKFHIDDVNKVLMNGKEVFKVKMTFKHNALTKHEWYIRIMNELEKLKKNDDIPYDSDPS
ncbi:uncharacterized protein LOC127277480 [Leptopilina boulardi]|uniref:uncharacterized protein LOC127277480 n=1 Tax=Leptopilina boulardi TaxID=63433 RepID=UPI0021F5B541|nr:uncharacterized protein LOC127277480 [Leptopilina boulardi]